MSKQLFFRAEVYQPFVVFAVTGGFNLTLHYTLHVYRTPLAQWSAFSACLLAAGVCAALLAFWQRNLRRHVKLLELHLQTRAVIEQRVRSSLTVILGIAEASRGMNPLFDENMEVIRAQIRTIEKRIAFDPSILVEVAMLASDVQVPTQERRVKDRRREEVIA